jgi:hypothetical protein
MSHQLQSARHPAIRTPASRKDLSVANSESLLPTRRQRRRKEECNQKKPVQVSHRTAPIT